MSQSAPPYLTRAPGPPPPTPPTCMEAAPTRMEAATLLSWLRALARTTQPDSSCLQMARLSSVPAGSKSAGRVPRPPRPPHAMTSVRSGDQRCSIFFLFPVLTRPRHHTISSSVQPPANLLPGRQATVPPNPQSPPCLLLSRMYRTPMPPLPQIPAPRSLRQ
jgi:hypothetical protein